MKAQVVKRIIIAAIIILAALVWYASVWHYSQPISISTRYYVDYMEHIPATLVKDDTGNYRLSVVNPAYGRDPYYTPKKVVVLACNSLGSKFVPQVAESERINDSYNSGPISDSEWNKSMPGVLLDISNSTIKSFVGVSTMRRGVLKGTLLGRKPRNWLMKAFMIDWDHYDYRIINEEEGMEVTYALIGTSGHDLILRPGYKYYLIHDNSMLKCGWREDRYQISGLGCEKYFIVRAPD